MGEEHKGWLQQKLVQKPHFSLSLTFILLFDLGTAQKCKYSEMLITDFRHNLSVDHMQQSVQQQLKGKTGFKQNQY